MRSNKINSVIAGDYAGKNILFDGIQLFISGAMFTKTQLNKQTVSSYSVMNIENGGMLRRTTAYTVSISFLDGKSSLVYLDGNFYNCLMKNMF